MYDWKQIVRNSLGDLRLGRSAQEEIVCELASHLEELYEAHRAQNLTDEEARTLCIQESAGGAWLARQIRQARNKETAMNHRTKTLWIPGLVTLTIASVTLMVVERMALHHPGWPVRDSALAYYLPWLVSLPFCGALGAYLSRRAGGTRTLGFASAAFPAIVMFAVFCMILPIAVFMEKNKFIIHHPLYFAVALAIWVIIPCVALLLGALLLLHYAASQAPTRIPA